MTTVRLQTQARGQNGLCLNSQCQKKAQIFHRPSVACPLPGCGLVHPRLKQLKLFDLCVFGQNQRCRPPLQNAQHMMSISPLTKESSQMPRCHRHVENPSWNVYFLNVEAKMGLEQRDSV